MTKYNPVFAYDVPPNSAAAKRLREQRGTHAAENRIALAKRLKKEFGSIAAAGRALGFDEMPGEAGSQAAQRAISLLRDPDSGDSRAQTAMRAIEVLLDDLDNDCRAAVRELLEQAPGATDYDMPQNGIEREQSRRNANDAVARAIDQAIRPTVARPRGALNPETFFAPLPAEVEVAATLDPDRFYARAAQTAPAGGSFEQNFFNRNRGRAA